jgi:hypothetical protein
MGSAEAIIYRNVSHSGSASWVHADLYKFLLFRAYHNTGCIVIIAKYYWKMCVSDPRVSVIFLTQSAEFLALYTAPVIIHQSAMPERQ